MNKESREMVAAKIIKVTTPEEQKAVSKEMAIHKLLNHENIIGIHGNRHLDDAEFIFLEYASGGELFDRIGRLTFNLLPCSSNFLTTCFCLFSSFRAR